jgi:hypothetical protein
VLTVRVGVNSSLILRLELGAITTEVMVQAEAVMVDTTKSTVQGVVTANMIDNLPLNGRNFFDLAQQTPGVQIVDGGLTKSGTNTWHGSGFGFFRRSEFAANNAPIICDNASLAAGLCDALNTPKPPFSRDNYGGRLGGPIIKNKLFVEAEYEKLQQVGANTTNVGPFPQFTGSFGVPVNEHMGGGRVDFNLTSKIGPLAPLRVGSGSGSFPSGPPRAFQFGIRVSF